MTKLRLLIPAMIAVAGFLLLTAGVQAQHGHGGGHGGGHGVHGGGFHGGGFHGYHHGYYGGGFYGPYRGGYYGAYGYPSIGIGIYAPLYAYPAYPYAPYGAAPRLSYYPAGATGLPAQPDPGLNIPPQGGPTDPAPANIRVIVPDPQAKVWFDGAPTSATGTDRLYHTSTLPPTGTYTYRVRAVWTQGGQEVIQERVLPVAAGRTSIADFTQPASEPVAPPKG